MVCDLSQRADFRGRAASVAKAPGMVQTNYWVTVPADVVQSVYV